MKHAITLAAALVCVSTLFATPAAARDTKYMLPFKDVLELPEAKEKLDGSVKFYLAGEKTPKVLNKMESDVSNKKTNGVGKSDEVACQWAALSVLVAFQDKAKSLGANAVVDMASYYRKNEVADAHDFECHAGAVVVGVAMKGTYAKVADK